MKRHLWALCVLGPVRVAAFQPPVLVQFAINDTAHVVLRSEPVLLRHRVVGVRPTHYRVSTRSDFAGAPWLAYTDVVAWDGPRTGSTPCMVGAGAHLLRLYFQVRAETGQELRIVDGQRRLVSIAVESNVLTDAICAE